MMMMMMMMMMTMIMMIIFRMVLEWSPQDGALYAWGAPLQATTFWYSKFFLFRRQNSLWRLLLPEVGATYKVWDQRWEMQWVMTFKQIPLVGSDRLTMNWYELMKLIEADVPKKVVDSHIFRSIQKPWFGVFMLGDSTSIFVSKGWMNTAQMNTIFSLHSCRCLGYHVWWLPAQSFPWCESVLQQLEAGNPRLRPPWKFGQTSTLDPPIFVGFFWCFSFWVVGEPLKLSPLIGG